MSLDDHLERVVPASFGALETTIDLLHAEKLPYALIGGWAVFAYGSRIPSIDTDVLMSQKAANQFRSRLQVLGMADQEGPGKHIEILAMDQPNELHGFDWELEDVPAYTPSEVLEGRTTQVTFMIQERQKRAMLPEPTVLAFMKLKAMHDRCFDYLAVTNPVHLGRINPSDRPLIVEKPAEHYLRKAGKDLADVAFLCVECTDLASALSEVVALRPHLERALSEIPQPILDYAKELVDKDSDRVGWIDAHARAIS